MSPDQDLLHQLHDIHLPTPIGAWPLAPGWYVLVGVVLAGVLWASIWGWRHHRHGRMKRSALSILARYERAYCPMMDTQSTSAALNELLKRVALAYFPRERVAQLYGRDWLIFLNETSQNLDFLSQEEVLLVCPYHKELAKDLRPLCELVRRWIQQRRIPCLS